MRSPDTLIELAEKMHRPRELYLKWAQVTERYERGKHTKFAEVFLRVKSALGGSDDGARISIRELECTAYADPEYKAYLEEWDKAEKEKIKAKVEFDNLENDFEAMQSALSYDRESLKKLG